jgi:hypothetical protein
LRCAEGEGEREDDLSSDKPGWMRMWMWMSQMLALMTKMEMEVPTSGWDITPS